MSKRKKEKRKTRHRWRMCPPGKHWRRAHPRRGTKGVRGHCVTNRSRKDQIYPEELLKIKERYFSRLKGAPSSDTLGYSRGSDYDALIRGWTRYWNEVLDPKEPLDPDLVKALIATESSFNPKAKAYAGKRAGHARGLMQVTDQTVKILKDEKGELRDHLVDVDQNDMEDPNTNIAAGVRWLFRKKEIADHKLKKDSNWIWAIAEYKSYTREYKKDPKHKQMNKIIKLHRRLKKK